MLAMQTPLCKIDPKQYHSIYLIYFMRSIFILCITFICTPFAFSQTLNPNEKHTHADTLRGSITPERAWWDLTYYHLNVKPNPHDSTLQGSTDVHYRVLKSYQDIQIDLQEPLKIDSVFQDGESLKFKRDGHAYFIKLIKKQLKGQNESIKVYYSGKPTLAKNPPWDGGVQWVRDNQGKSWISSCMMSPMVS
jgi:hypothetical protein